MPSVAVVGAGLTGLTAAFRLKRRGVRTALYEATDRPGGVVRSERRDGYLVELGPNTIASPGPALAALLAELGLEGRQLVAGPEAARRYVVRGGRLRPLPMSPGELLTSRLLSNGAKLAIFGEPLVDAAEGVIEESVAAFVRRRFNQEVLDYVADPFVAGVFAGDPEQLSVRHALPKLQALESSHGSLVKAMVQLARARRTGEASLAGATSVISFPDGLQEIPAALARELGGDLRTGRAVRAVRSDGERWLVLAAGGEAETHDAVICTVPAYALGELEFHLSGSERLATLASIAHPPVAVLALGFRRDDVGHPLDGFGFLTPGVERRHVLGVLFSTTLFAGRAPDGEVLVTAFVGGARDPQFAELDEHTLAARVLDDLHSLLGVRGAPTFRAFHLWPRAIPQYVLGYGRFKDLLDEVERRNPGFHLAGSYRGGVSLADAIASGEQAAARVAGRLAEAA